MPPTNLSPSRLSHLGAFLLMAVPAVWLAAEPQAPQSTKVAEVARLLTGDFSSAEQAKGDKDYLVIHLHMRPIWKTRTDGPWFYVEQAAATAVDKPYRQRIYQLVQRADGNVESLVYTFDEPLRLAGAWRQPERLDALSPSDLKLRSGCAVLLERKPDGTYAGATVGKACASDLRGAAYATSVVTLGAGEFVSWDRGYNATDVQVWGATAGPYIFRRTAFPEPTKP